MRTSLSPVFIIIILFFLPSHYLRAQGGRIPVPAENGMVVSGHYLASEVGKEILQKGGNSVDASVATTFALSVCLPSAGNIGGGGFMVYYGSDGEKTTFNFREKAPLAATEKMYLEENGEIKDNSNHDGILAVGVPGTVAGLYLAHQEKGKLLWQELLKPAILLAEEGIPVSHDMIGFLKWLKENKGRTSFNCQGFSEEWPGNL